MLEVLLKLLDQVYKSRLWHSGYENHNLVVLGRSNLVLGAWFVFGFQLSQVMYFGMIQW
ncbi:unnamed protein product, partial [Hapterophycus canaliculatus]